MTTIAIIGGTGMLGAPVANQLLQDGAKVRIISRNPNQVTHLAAPNKDIVYGDIFNVESLKTALQDVDAVHINLSGNSAKTYYQNPVIGTQNLLKALKGQTLNAISMISVATADPEYSDRADNRFKLAAENLLKDSGQPYLIFRPSWFMETLPLFQQKKKMIHIGPSSKPIHWLSAGDYAHAVSRAILRDTDRHKTMTLYGPEPITMATAIARYAAHHHLSVQKMPVWLAKLIGKLTRDASLVDAADLLAHYDQTGEKDVPEAWRTTTTLSQWLTREVIE